VEVNELKIVCENVIKKTIERVKPLPGGDINLTFQIETSNEFYFCKTNSSGIGADLLEKEAHGLKVLSRYCNVPDIIASTPKVLILSWIIDAKKSKVFWQKLGEHLANLHKITSNKFGFDRDGYIGTLHQANGQYDDWNSFYVAQRLEPQLRLAVDKGLLATTDFGSIELMEKIVNIVTPTEPATLIHGDLWSGNILCNENGEPYIIDPCISYAHREMDIAMSMLFGKFDPVFYEAYHEARPLEVAYKDRMDIYQLYYLLAHLNMFGIGYKNDVLKIINRYFK
jgi:fructosamine-3-kinase